MYIFKFNNNVSLPDEVNNNFNELARIISSSSGDVRIVAVTSSNDGEGKTFVASQVASALAKRDYRVMLLMADMRKTTAIDEKVTMGIMDVVSGKTTIENVMYDTDIEGVNIIFSGVTRENEKVDIDRNVYGVMLKCLKEEYNYIIVDMSTMGKTNNDDVFLKESDAGIMVIQPDSCSKKKIKQNIKKINDSSCKLLGAVLNNR